MDKDTITVLEFLCSKICHDLISPIGAIGNGVEFLEDMSEGDDDPNKDIVDLIAFSARQGSAKLQAFRVAYGAGGSDPNIKPADIHEMFGKLIKDDGKITQEWEPYELLPAHIDRPDGFCKILMLGLLLAQDALPKGGKITIPPVEDSCLTIHCAGENTGLRDVVLDALDGKIQADALEPKSVQSFTARLMAQHYGYAITAAPKGDDFKIVINIPE